MKKQSNTIQSKSEEIHEAVDKCILENFVGEPCNQKTRDAIFEFIKNKIDLNGYELTCDQTNNTPEDVLVGKIVFDVKKSNGQNNL